MYMDTHCKISEEFEPTHTYVVRGPCCLTRKETVVRIPGPALFKIRQGMHIQDAAPMLSAGDREFLLTGMSDEGWKMME